MLERESAKKERCASERVHNASEARLAGDCDREKKRAAMHQ